MKGQHSLGLQSRISDTKSTDGARANGAPESGGYCAALSTQNDLG